MRSTSGAGIDSVHVYAYARGGLAPAVFLGAATLGQARDDVGEALGTRFEHSGFTLTAPLAPGRYRFVAYTHSNVTGLFGPPAQALATAVAGPDIDIESPAPGVVPETVTIGRGTRPRRAVGQRGGYRAHLGIPGPGIWRTG